MIIEELNKAYQSTRHIDLDLTPEEVAAVEALRAIAERDYDYFLLKAAWKLLKYEGRL